MKVRTVGVLGTASPEAARTQDPVAAGRASKPLAALPRGGAGNKTPVASDRTQTQGAAK